jgi:uncharacterized protein (TIGR02145 family)
MPKYLILIIFQVFTSFIRSQEIIKDIDGNIYHTETIGNTIWFLENLKVTRFNNGDSIATTSNVNQSLTNSSHKYRWNITDAKNQTSNQLYTWHTINDHRGVCPTGWTIPSDKNWKEAIDLLLNESNSSQASNQLNFPNFTYKDNILENKHPFCTTLEFSGSRISNGRYIFKDIYAYYWTSTIDYDGFAWMWYFSHNSVMHYNFEQNGGLSVKCVKLK